MDLLQSNLRREVTLYFAAWIWLRYNKFYLNSEFEIIFLVGLKDEKATENLMVKLTFSDLDNDLVKTDKLEYFVPITKNQRL